MEAQKQATPKKIAKKITTMRKQENTMSQIVNGIQEALLFESNSMHQSGTENGLFDLIKQAFNKLTTETDIENARISIYDRHYEFPSEGKFMLGRKGNGTTSKEVNRKPAPKTLSNVFSLCNQAVRDCVTGKDGQETQFGYKQWLPAKGLHAFESINDEENSELGLKVILRDKKNDPDRLLRNQLIAQRKKALADEVAENKEAMKLDDKGYAKYIAKNFS